MWERGTKCTLTRLHGCFLWWGENTVLFFLPDYVDSGHLENLVSGGSAPFGGETRRTFTKQTQCHLAAGVGESGGGLPASHAGAETNQDTLRHLWPKWHALWQLNITRGFINQEKSHKSIKIHQRLVKEDFFIIGFIWPLFHWEVTLRLKSFFFSFTSETEPRHGQKSSLMTTATSQSTIKHMLDYSVRTRQHYYHRCVQYSAFTWTGSVLKEHSVVFQEELQT